MKRIRVFAAMIAASIFAAGIAYSQVSIPNYMNQFGWHVGGVLEILSGGTFRLDTGTKTGTAVSGAVTLNKLSGSITSESLTTAAAATYTLTVADSAVAATDQVLVSVQNGSNTGGLPEVATVSPGSGTLVIVIHNDHASAALNGTLKITFADIKI